MGRAILSSDSDIDLLGRLNNSVNALVPDFREVFQLAVEPDGLVFAVESVVGQVIKEDADYSRVRVTFQASLEDAPCSHADRRCVR